MMEIGWGGVVACGKKIRHITFGDNMNPFAENETSVNKEIGKY